MLSTLDPFPAKDVLTTLLSVQALLVAGSTLAATMNRTPVLKPTPKDYGPQQIACALAWLMVLVAAGGCAAWYDVFICDSNGIESVSDVIQATALLVPLLVIPVFGFKAARWAAPS